MLFPRVWGKMIHEKTWSKNSSDIVPLSYAHANPIYGLHQVPTAFGLYGSSTDPHSPLVIHRPRDGTSETFSFRDTSIGDELHLSHQNQGSHIICRKASNHAPLHSRSFETQWTRKLIFLATRSCYRYSSLSLFLSMLQPKACISCVIFFLLILHKL